MLKPIKALACLGSLSCLTLDPALGHELGSNWIFVLISEPDKYIAQMNTVQSNLNEMRNALTLPRNPNSSADFHRKVHQFGLHLPLKV